MKRQCLALSGSSESDKGETVLPVLMPLCQKRLFLSAAHCAKSPQNSYIVLVCAQPE